mmetsp:Transcript_91052/g.257818  ORF Transcript_91052/g.257818 Transcript_91052/m.257818 type:complete len:203 (-) Transcript_91052:3-611(-)
MCALHLYDATHKDLDDIARHCFWCEPHRPAELLLGRGLLAIGLVAEHRDRHRLERGHGEQILQLLSGLSEPGGVGGVHQEEDRAGDGEVLLPKPAARLVPGEVEGLEADLVDYDLHRRGVEGGLLDDHLVVLQNLQDRRLARVVEAEEDENGVDGVGCVGGQVLLADPHGRHGEPRALMVIRGGRHPSRRPAGGRMLGAGAA